MIDNASADKDSQWTTHVLQPRKEFNCSSRSTLFLNNRHVRFDWVILINVRDNCQLVGVSPKVCMMPIERPRDEARGLGQEICAVGHARGMGSWGCESRIRDGRSISPTIVITRPYREVIELLLQSSHETMWLLDHRMRAATWDHESFPLTYICTLESLLPILTRLWYSYLSVADLLPAVYSTSVM
jgi:hypothetical protein